MTKNKSLNFILIIVTLTLLSMPGKSQILKDSQFRIYRAESILGAVTQLRINPDSTYNMYITEINCSLCDHKELINMITKIGKWTQSQDTIQLDKKKKLLVLGDSIVRPLYAIGMSTDSIMTAKHGKIINPAIGSSFSDFHLIYDTYPNGIARQIIDKYRMRTEEYEIQFELNGSVKGLKYYLNGKQRNKLK